jgi:cell division protein FtsN
MRDSNKLKDRYEVSLDSRQIATLAVASLIVLGGVFLLGVVVGKKLTFEGLDRSPADLLGQLDRKAADLESLKRQQDASLTFQEELTRKVPEPVRPVDPVKAPEKPVVASPAPAPEPAPVVKLPESPRSEPVATRTHDGGGLKDAFVKVQKAPAEAAADGAWTLQLAAYQDRAEADRFSAGLREKGYAPYILQVSLPARGQWFRVRMGRFPSKESAARYLEDFKRETSMNAIVTGAN